MISLMTNNESAFACHKINVTRRQLKLRSAFFVHSISKTIEIIIGCGHLGTDIRYLMGGLGNFSVHEFFFFPQLLGRIFFSAPFLCTIFFLKMT
jgi:hypothetical protein